MYASCEAVKRDAFVIEMAVVTDAEALRRVALSAFAVDETFKPEGAVAGGPPGSDSQAQQREWIRRWDYYKCCLGEKIVGGCIIKPHHESLELFGLFVDGAHMRAGIGTRMLNAVMTRYPAALPWTLLTPDYATGNHRFYESLGFHLHHRSPVEPDLGFGFHHYRR
jgi:GNAT superfamily N-acetyltransferase